MHSLFLNYTLFGSAVFLPLEKFKIKLRSMYYNIPRVTKHLIIINILMFFATIVASRYEIDLNDYLALHYFQGKNFYSYQLITYMFMHDGVAHLFFNMFALLMFGSAIERAIGEQRFLIYYLFCGFGAGVVQEISQFVEYYYVLSNYTQVKIGDGVIISLKEFLDTRGTVGASGSVYGVLLAFGMLYPNERLFIFPVPIPIRAKFMIVGYIVIELYLAIANKPNDLVAHFAHLGGMLFGFLLLMYWIKRRKR